MTDSFSQQASDGTILKGDTLNQLAQLWAWHQNTQVWSGLTHNEQTDIINMYWRYLKVQQQEALGTGIGQ